MNLTLILGTSHKGRMSEKVFSFMKERIKAKEKWDINLVDASDFLRKRTGEEIEGDKKLKNIFQNTDAYVIVSPEYNHSYPGELKLFLDNFYTEYTARPVGFCGVSSGLIGGARAVEQLKLVAIDINMIPIHKHLYFGEVQNLFEGDKFIKNDMDSEIDDFLNELFIYAKNLKSLRDELLKR